MTDGAQITDDEEGPGADPRASRRRFLKWLIRVGYLSFAVAFLLPALALKTLTRERKTIAAGDPLVYATGDRAGQPVQATDLQPGDSVQAFPQGKTSDEDNIIELVRLKNDQSLVGYSAICTHLGCTVFAALNGQGYIHCPCHGSEFDPAHRAKVVRGPAGRPLPSIQVAAGKDGQIVATSAFSGPIGPQ
ncbi:MAG TPA: ubiquinol-cytochrome c reductase iron-sulfur subunit [Thermomicrobiales bacterium]|nr:ubiquinol-cytochrome c reductase iron-sulfur subunit [Thermomicrobiales bacterium]